MALLCAEPKTIVGTTVGRFSVIRLIVFMSLVVGGISDEARAERYLIRFKASRAVSRTSDAAAFQAELAGAQPRRILPLDNSVVVDLSPEQVQQLSQSGQFDSIEQDGKIRAFFVPNDSSYFQQYGLKSPNGISAQTAWNYTRGSSNKIVAIIDSGANVDHPDLVGNVWQNSSEVPNNGLDDDANGFTDDYRGYDFAEDDGDVSDGSGHGTHVAGIVAATGNNAFGTIGVAWETNFIPVKCLNSEGEGTIFDLVESLDYVSTMKDRGVPISVVNLSLGTDQYSDSLFRAIERVVSRGILIVAAAGNEASNNDTIVTYPAGFDSDGIISVAASNGDGELASFSNYGLKSVDVVAPGDVIFSTFPDGVFSWQSGTSMAAPHVTGIAALVAAINTRATLPLIRSLILSTTVPRSSLRNSSVTGGIVNARGAVVMGLASRRKYHVSGTVKEGGKGVKHVTIYLRSTNGVYYRRTALTNATGRFLLTDVPRGTYTITSYRAPYSFISSTRRIAVTSHKTVDFVTR